jgi:hypothetical protein
MKTALFEKGTGALAPVPFLLLFIRQLLGLFY